MTVIQITYADNQEVYMPIISILISVILLGIIVSLVLETYSGRLAMVVRIIFFVLLLALIVWFLVPKA